MDYSLETPEERNQKVKEIIEKTPPEKLTAKYLEKLADYIVFAMDKQERKNKKILTENRLVTVGKRETSFEGLAGKLENGEDGLYNLIANDKNIIFAPKVSITEEDIATIPGLKELREAIENIEEQAKKATGLKAYSLKQQAIKMRQDQYVIKNAYRKPIYCVNALKSFGKLDLSEEIKLDKNTKDNIDVVVDRLIIKDGIRSRLFESIETGIKLSKGKIVIDVVGDKEIVMSENYACPYCDYSLPELEPRIFSFNAPYGACPECKGLGFRDKIDFDLIVPDKSKSLNQGAIVPYRNMEDTNIIIQKLEILCDKYNIDMNKPIDKFILLQKLFCGGVFVLYILKKCKKRNKTIGNTS
jgi:hypothetical protein